MSADQLTTPTTSLESNLGWHQTNIEFADWTSAAEITTRHLCPIFDGAVAGWWYIRKHPHWRLRFRCTRPEVRQGLHDVLDELTERGTLLAWHSAIYEPEMLAFGGSAGMQVAHDLFCTDSRTTLALLAQPRPPAGGPARSGRVELSVLAISGMLRAAGLDWFEQGDVWARIAESRQGLDSRPHPTRVASRAAVQRLITLDTTPTSTLVVNGPLTEHAAWLAGFDYAGTRLADLARTGQLTRGLRAVLAHHAIFHWNRLALPGRDQHTIAILARDALLPTDQQTP